MEKQADIGWYRCNKINIFLVFFSLRVTKTKNNKVEIFTNLFIVLPVLNLLKT